MTREHLSDESLNDILIGMGSEPSESHLAGCALCRGRVEEFESNLGAWNAATLHWSEARAGRTRVHPAPRRLPLAVLGWALAALALVGIAIPVARESGVFGSRPNAAQVTPAPQEDSEAQIEQDNEMLKAVNAAINPHEVLPREMLPLREYDLSGRDRSRPRHRQK